MREHKESCECDLCEFEYQQEIIGLAKREGSK